MAKEDHHLHTLPLEGGTYKTQLTAKFVNRKNYRPANLKKVTAVIPGTIVKIMVKPGQRVNPGKCLFSLEAMKMKNRIFAETGGIVSKIHVNEGDVVSKNQLLLELADAVKPVSAQKENKTLTSLRARMQKKNPPKS